MILCIFSIISIFVSRSTSATITNEKELPGILIEQHFIKKELNNNFKCGNQTGPVCADDCQTLMVYYQKKKKNSTYIKITNQNKTKIFSLVKRLALEMMNRSSVIYASKIIMIIDIVLVKYVLSCQMTLIHNAAW